MQSNPLSITPTYPEIDMFTESGTIKICTIVRVKNKEGKYCLIKVIESSVGTDEKTLINTMKRFHFNVYLSINFGMPNIDMVDHHGNSVCPIDNDQSDEKDRMLNRYII